VSVEVAVAPGEVGVYEATTAVLVPAGGVEVIVGTMAVLVVVGELLAVVGVREALGVLVAVMEGVEVLGVGVPHGSLYRSTKVCSGPPPQQMEKPTPHTS
jgi:hypothetical protein